MSESNNSGTFLIENGIIQAKGLKLALEGQKDTEQIEKQGIWIYFINEVARSCWKATQEGGLHVARSFAACGGTTTIKNQACSLLAGRKKVGCGFVDFLRSP